MRRIFFAQESLAIDRVVEDQKAAQSETLFDETYQAIDQQVEEASQPDTEDAGEPETDSPEADDTSDTSDPEDPQPDTPDESGDAVTADSSKDVEPDNSEKSGQPEPSEEPDTKEQELATEAWDESRQHDYRVLIDALLETRQRFATESLSQFAGTVGRHVVNTGTGVLNVAGGVAKTGVEMGFAYGPIAFKHVSKALGYALRRGGEGLHKTLIWLKEAHRQYELSYKTQLKRIEKAKEAVAALTRLENLHEPIEYTKHSVVPRLKRNDQWDPSASIEHLRTAFERYHQSIQRNTVVLYGWAERVLAAVVQDRHEKPNQFGAPYLDFKVYQKRSVPGYTPNSDTVETYYDPVLLPGDVHWILYIPKHSLSQSDDESLLTAYKSSRFFFGIDMRAIEQQTAAKTATLDELEDLLNRLESLCRYGMSQTTVFTAWSVQQQRLAKSYQRYVDVLLQQPESRTIRSSMIEFVAPVVQLLDRLTVKSNQDWNDYVNRTMTAALTYVSDSIEVLRQPVESES